MVEIWIFRKKKNDKMSHQKNPSIIDPHFKKFLIESHFFNPIKSLDQKVPKRKVTRKSVFLLDRILNKNLELKNKDKKI